jgi:hypothetical protein
MAFSKQLFLRWPLRRNPRHPACKTVKWWYSTNCLELPWLAYLPVLTGDKKTLASVDLPTNSHRFPCRLPTVTQARDVHMEPETVSPVLRSPTVCP